MKKGLLYIHGKGGNPAEAEHYKPLFPQYDVVGMDYQAQNPWEAIEEFDGLFDKFQKEHDSIILVANSIGAFFAMYALKNKPIAKAYFISPIADMESLITDMLLWTGSSESELEQKGTICTDFGETLSWEYLSWIREHTISWSIPTRILYGGRDNLQSLSTIQAFAENINAEFTIMENGEHWFHTNEQMDFLDSWIFADN